MPASTRSRRREDSSKEDALTSLSRNVTSTPPRQTPVGTKSNMPTIPEKSIRRGTKKVDPPSKEVESTASKGKKHRLTDSEGSDEEAITSSTKSTPSRAHTGKIVPSRTDNKNAVEVGPRRETKRIGFAGLENMALKAFINILANKGVNACRAEVQRFSDLKVEKTEHRAVDWKTIPGSRTSTVKMPKTATPDECSVFAVEASTMKEFEEQAEKFLGDTMGSETLKYSMALMVHYDSDGKPQSAMVGFPFGRPFYCYSDLEPETANMIAMRLKEGKGAECWHLALPRERASKKRKLGGINRKAPAEHESDSST